MELSIEPYVDRLLDLQLAMRYLLFVCLSVMNDVSCKTTLLLLILVLLLLPIWFERSCGARYCWLTF